MWTVKPSQSHHWITVKTGDRKGAETNATIKLILRDDQQRESPVITLHEEGSGGSRSFDAGCINTRQAPVLDNLSSLVEIELWREPVISDARAQLERPADWYCELIAIKDTRDMQDYYFPVHRWLVPGSRDAACLIPLYDTSLPLSMKESVYGDHAMRLQAQREKELDRKRQQYQYAWDEAGMAKVASLPDDEKFSEHYEEVTGLGDTRKQLEAGDAAPEPKRWQNRQEIKDYLYKTLNFPIPKGLPCCSVYRNEYFGAQRLVGANPVMLERCLRDLPDKMKAKSDDVKDVLNKLDSSKDWSVSQAIEEHRLYFTDYKILDGIKTIDNQKFVAPIALFFRNTEEKLLPVAIQLYQDENGLPNPIFYADSVNRSSNTWMLAKMWLNLADSTYHMALSHLGFTHFLMEGVCVAMHRNLASNHPIYRLLAPHFLFTLNLNMVGRQLLFGQTSEDGSRKNGALDLAMAMGVKGYNELVKRRFAEWKLDSDGSPRQEFANRNVMSESELPCYPFRDDSLLMYDAIEEYVTAIVNIYYDDSNSKIREDAELQSWGQDLSNPKEENGLGIKGVPHGGRFQTNAALIQTVSSLIYTCTAKHAAIDFNQYDQYGFPPNYPIYLYGEPPKDENHKYTDLDLAQALPDNIRSAAILNLTVRLHKSAVQRLGYWEMKYQYDPPAQAAEKKFRLTLEKIAKEIKNRNVDRPQMYRYEVLCPENVPNSISF